MRIFRHMRHAAPVLLLAWFFYAYPLDAAYALAPSSSLRGPYPVLWSCLRDALDLEIATRGRVMTTPCFLGTEE